MLGLTQKCSLTLSRPTIFAGQCCHYTWWVSPMLYDPKEILRRGYPSSYIVLTLCRILYTLQFGDVVSKPKAARWVKRNSEREMENIH